MLKYKITLKFILKEEYEEDKIKSAMAQGYFFVVADLVLIHRQRWQQRRLPLKNGHFHRKCKRRSNDNRRYSAVEEYGGRATDILLR